MSALPQKICIPRRDADALLNLSHNASFRLLPPRAAKGVVLVADVMKVLERTSRNGAPHDALPKDLLTVEDVSAMTGLSHRRVHALANSRRMRIPHYWVSNKNVLFREEDIVAAVTAKAKRVTQKKQNDLTHALTEDVGNLGHKVPTKSHSTGE